MNTDMYIQTGRLALRDFKPEDFEAFYATTNDPQYRQFYAEGEMRQDFWEELFDRILAGAEAAERKSYQLAVCLSEGELIGTCGVRIEDAEHQQASFGCAIGRGYWGKGYAFEAAYGLFDFAFASLPVHRIYAETISENSRARALAERLGMRPEGQLQDHKFFKGRWWDSVIYAILKHEWKSHPR